MSREVIFSLYLNERMEAARMDVVDLAREMNYRTLVPVGNWINGSTLPQGYQLKDLAAVLNADPVVMAVAWVIAQCPELEPIMRREILRDRPERVPELL